MAGKLDEHLPGILAGEEVKERGRRILKAVNDRLLPLDLALRNPLFNVALEILPEVEIVGADESLEPDALFDNRVNVARAGLCTVVLLDHSAEGEAGKIVGNGKGSLQMRAADIVEINVDAMGSRLTQGSGQVGYFFVIDRCINTGLLAQR